MNALRPESAEFAAAVSERELRRLLGVPRGRELAGELDERAEGARRWYAGHGRPFAAARRVAVDDVAAAEVRLQDGTRLRSGALASGLRDSHGHAVVALAVSAGREVAAEASRLWASGRPDEAYFLDRFAAAVTEALVLWASGASCRDASAAGETLLPPLSPGCGDFEIGDQQRLMHLLGGRSVASREADVPGANAAAAREAGRRNAAGEPRLRLGPIELLATGALDPPSSLLAALGVTRRPLAPTTPEDLCRACALEPCGFRRAPRASRLALELEAR